MKEHIDTIPVNDAFDSGDECPFCWLERKAEQSTIRYVAGPGASYMEPDVRAATDAAGFCGVHLEKLYDYGNTLGSALMLQTHMAGLLTEFRAGAEGFTPPVKHGIFGKKNSEPQETWWQRLHKRQERCFICERREYHMTRYFHTFFVMLREPEFREKVAASKGFCLRHFAKLMDLAETELPNSQHEWFYSTVLSLTEENLLRVKKDLDWLIAKYDYRNAGADWKNSRDALPRTMQKIQGLHPADPPYKEK
ncbi:MAG: hypothetical protein E7439_00750 [Ruminococcaceae bacterium]|nr:hypothetical protein [Oscillospiraceae bacterium]